MTAPQSAFTAARAADRTGRHARTVRNRPGTARTAIRAARRPALAVADQRRTIRAESGPVRRTVPGTRAGSRIASRTVRSAVR